MISFLINTKDLAPSWWWIDVLYGEVFTYIFIHTYKDIKVLHGKNALDFRRLFIGG
jgi:hypothetical protein